MSKGSKSRPYSNKDEFYSNWDKINWNNKKEHDSSAVAPPVEKILKTPLDDNTIPKDNKN